MRVSLTGLCHAAAFLAERRWERFGWGLGWVGPGLARSIFGTVGCLHPDSKTVLNFDTGAPTQIERDFNIPCCSKLKDGGREKK